MTLASCHHSGALNSDMSPKFLKICASCLKHLYQSSVSIQIRLKFTELPFRPETQPAVRVAGGLDERSTATNGTISRS